MRLFQRSDEDVAVPRRSCAVTAGELVERHPGIALLVAAAGDVLATSQSAAPLVAGGPSGPWWDEVYGWLSRDGDDAGAARTTRIDLDRGQAVVDWTAVALPDNTVALFGRDVTLDHNLRDALSESRQRFRDLVDIACDFAWETDADARFVYVSPEGALGYAAEDLVGGPSDRLLTDDGGTTRSPFEARRPIARAEVWLRGADGRDACVVAWARPLYDANKTWCGTRGLCREVTDIRQRDAALTRSRTRERLLAHIVKAMRDEVEPERTLEIAAHATVNAVGADGCRVYRRADQGGFALASEFHQVPEAGAVAAGLIGQAGLVERADGADAPWVDRLDGIITLAVGTRSRQGTNGVLVLWRSPDRGDWDEEDRQLIQAVGDQMGIAIVHIAYFEWLRDQAERDGMTKLLNRRTLEDRLAEQLDPSAGDGGALLYVDIDNFKAVNDCHGHQRGDAVLTEVTAILQSSVESSDLCGRMGGDEFVLWLAAADRARGEAVAEALVAKGRGLAPHSASADRPAGLSVGVALCCGGAGETVDGLIERADKAMYRAKQTARTAGGGGGWAWAVEAAR